MQTTSQGLLPDFCANRTVFLVILIAQLLAFILAFTVSGSITLFWGELALISLFIQWIALGAAATLCYCRHWIARLPIRTAVIVVYGLSQLITLLFSLGALWVTNNASFQPASDNAAGFFLLRNIAISSIVSLVALRYFYIQQRWKQNIEAESKARFQALQARIRPHFLFNSLNTIASLIPHSPKQAEETILDLADLFRFTMEQKDRVNLREELEITRRYLQIEALRLGERLQIDWCVADNVPLDTPIPVLILQPLMENAIYHGIQSLPEGGRIAFLVETQGRTLHVAITNSYLVTDTRRYRPGNRMAQSNIRQRLALAYDSDGAMTIHKSADTYSVSLAIPLETPP